MRPDGPRDSYAGPESGVDSPFPIKLSGPVIKGFGRGSKEYAKEISNAESKRPTFSIVLGLAKVRSKEATISVYLMGSRTIKYRFFKPNLLSQLGIPTANIPPEGLSAYPSLETGVYYGFSALRLSPSSRPIIYPSVLSIGYNPFYKNSVRSVEIHILNDFEHDFYGSSLNLLILGFIRPEYDYVSIAALIDDIKTDCDVARRSLERSAYISYKREAWLMDFDWANDMRNEDVKKLEAELLAKDVKSKHN